jgi:hypothetical protein
MRNDQDQLDRGEMLDEVARWRNESAIRRSDVLRWELCIPFSDHAALIRYNPEFRSRDPIERTRAWLRFLASDASKPYRVQRARGPV